MPKKITHFHKTLLCILVLFSTAFGYALAAETGGIAGGVYEKASKEPVSGVKVVLVEKGFTALTDESGRYEFTDLAPGDYTLRNTTRDYETAVKKITVESGKIVAADFYLELSAFEVGEIVVTGKRPITSSPSKVVVTGSDIKIIPGTGGDALRAIQAMPGISARNDFSGQLCIRGGGPDDNSFYFDRISLFAPYHFMGFASTLNSDIIKQVDVYAGGFDAKYGDAQAVIDIVARDVKKEKISGTMNVNMLMAEGLIEGTVSEKTSWYLAGRRSYIDLFPIEADQIIALPKFWDYQSKLVFEFSENSDLSFTAFGAEDFMKLRLQEEDVTNDPDLAGDFHWRNGYHSQGITLKTGALSKLSSYLTLSHSYMLWDMAMGKGYYIRSMPHIYNLRGDAALVLSEQYSVETGFNAGFSDFTMEAFFIRPPTEEGEGRPGFTDSDKVEVNTEERMSFGNVYVQMKYTPIELLSLTLGGRGDYYEQIDEFAVSPRGSLSLRLANGTDLRLACGEYIQQPNGAEASPDWGNPDLSSVTSYHYVLEFQRQFSESNLCKLAIYHKRLDDLVTPDPAEVYLNQGEGFAEGIEVFLRREDTERFLGWLSYSYSLSKRKDNPAEPWRLYSYDQTHVLTAVANYKLTSTWEIGGKWRYATGTPYTPIIGSVEIVDPLTGYTRWKAIYGDKNSERLPPYHRLDIRLSKAFKIKGVNMTAYLEVMNAYYHKNLLSLSYNDDYTEEEKVYMLPIIPYFGITAKF